MIKSEKIIKPSSKMVESIINMTEYKLNIDITWEKAYCVAEKIISKTKEHNELNYNFIPKDKLKKIINEC
jgi:hypothetical protein